MSFMLAAVVSICAKLHARALHAVLLHCKTLSTLLQTHNCAKQLCKQAPHLCKYVFALQHPLATATPGKLLAVLPLSVCMHSSLKKEVLECFTEPTQAWECHSLTAL